MLSTSALSSPQSPSGVRQDWFMMTGDLIINLASEKAGEPRVKPARLSSNKVPDEMLLEQSQSQQKQRQQQQQQQRTTQTEQLNEQRQQQEQTTQTTTTTPQPTNEHHHQQQQQQTTNTTTTNQEDIDNVERIDLKHKHSTLTRSAASNASSGVADLDDDEPMSISNSSSPEPENIKNSHNNNNNNNCNKNNKNHNNTNINNNHHHHHHHHHLHIDEDEDAEYYCDDDNQPAYENVRELKRRIAQNDSKAMMNSAGDCDYVMSRSFDFIDSPEDECQRIAYDLYHLNGYHKSEVSQNLSKNNDYSRRIAGAYLKYFDFTAMKLDEALRVFLSRFHLNGETYEQERVLIYFSKRYHECNLDTNFASTDSIHTLVCALMLLNTDLHEDVILRKMSCSDFISNLAGLNDGGNYSPELLKYLYYSIKSKPLGWNDEFCPSSTTPDRSISPNGATAAAADPSTMQSKGHQKQRTGSMFSKMTTISRSIPASVTAVAAGVGSAGYISATMSRKFPSSRTIDSSMTNATSTTSPFVLLPNPAVAIEYKRGYIRRKCCRDSGSKRTPKGKRKWRMFYVTLRDLVLYLRREESQRQATGIEDFEDTIRIHHAVASQADDYTKRPFVFRLITADQAEYLFETSDSRELQSWITVINTTAASLSAPPLPLPVGSSPSKINLRKRPPLPMSHTKLSQAEQLRDQENKLLSLQKDLEEVHGELSKAKLSSSLHRALIERERFLGHEVSRYRVYISCLKMKALESTASLLSSASNNDVVINNDDGTSQISVNPSNCPDSVIEQSSS